MNILDVFKSGKSIELGNTKPKHIVTVISNVFIFNKKAYKKIATHN